MTMILRAVACLSAIAVALPAVAQPGGGDDIMSKAINKPSINYSIYGPGTFKVVRDATVQGGQAMRVTVPAKGATPYEVGMRSPLTKPIKAGDEIVTAVWMRAPKLKDGETTPVANVGVAMANAPYTTISATSIDVTNAWKLYESRGVSGADYAADAINVSLHMAADKHVVDLGPVFVLDLGPKPKR